MSESIINAISDPTEVAKFDNHQEEALHNDV